MLCPLCSKENKEGAKFCGNCGGSLAGSGSGDILSDVLGLGLPKATPPADVGKEGLDDLFSNLAQRSTRPAPAVPKAAEPPLPPKTSAKLSIEDLIREAPSNATPPATADEARSRAAEPPPIAAQPAAPPMAAPGAFSTPPPMPPKEGDQRRGPRYGGGPPAPPAETALALPAEVGPARAERAFVIFVDLLLLGVLGELLRHLWPQAQVQAGAAGAAAIIVLLLMAIKPTAFDSRHFGKVLLLDTLFLGIWAYENHGSLSSKTIFHVFEPPVVLPGIFAAVVVFAGLSVLRDDRFPKPMRVAYFLLALFASASFVEAIVRAGQFDGVMSGKEGLGPMIPQDVGFLEPAWVAVNGVLPLAIVPAFFWLMWALRHRMAGHALSAALTLAILVDAARFGTLSMEAAGRPGLRSALARADRALIGLAAEQGVTIPPVLPTPSEAPAPSASTPSSPSKPKAP